MNTLLVKRSTVGGVYRSPGSRNISYKARQRRGLITSAELGLEGPPAPLYFNERLTRLNRQLFAKAREECRHHKWKYCWIKSGRIYLRKEQDSQDR
ncbi:Zinc finger DNA binding protein [Operophtera brumata]|uniref:Zinc finger DNA binding protein n=1 Tax=Operophtera brumata TaxID=104452 RepID=A0A0L7LLI7_OPEBR|nr:Zinc finger DNA binding protein [Operophtera brumata]